MRQRLLIKLWFMLLSVLLAAISAGAQENPRFAPFDLTSLEQALLSEPIPPRDRIALAQRLSGVTDIPAPPTSAAPLHVGMRQVFYAVDSDANVISPVPATLHAVGEHLYLWVQDSRAAEVDDEDLHMLVARFDGTIYDDVRNLWGSEAIPGIDGDTHVYGLFTDQVGSNVAAYFWSTNTLPREVVASSNEHEMFLFNVDAFLYYDADTIASVVAHEFQHMIRANVQANEETWLNEGLSTFTETLLFDNNSMSNVAFMMHPDTQLNTWSEDTSLRAANYGAANLFLTYFYDRFGLDAMRRLGGDNAPRGLTSVDRVLHMLGEPGVEVFFADWVVANIAQRAPLYGYTSLTLDATTIPVTPINWLPASITDETNQYGSDYYNVSAIPGDSLAVSLDIASVVGVIPTEAPSGSRFWYSNRADLSDTTLTHAFDLTGVTSATLEYKVWYAFEEFWDYGYLMVSADDGATWDILNTPFTARQNPNDTAYGAGYTGSLAGETWLSERVSLDAYAGQSILVRFEMITDDAVSLYGMAIDDVKIAALGYTSTFETDDGGWTAAGWVWSENVLPQHAWVQWIEDTPDGVIVTRHLVPDEGTRFTFERTPGATRSILAISGLATVTTVPMPYTLSVE